MLEQLRRNWYSFSHWSSGKVIGIILLLFHNLIPKCQQNLGLCKPANLGDSVVMFFYSIIIFPIMTYFCAHIIMCCQTSG